MRVCLLELMMRIMDVSARAQCAVCSCLGIFHLCVYVLVCVNACVRACVQRTAAVVAGIRPGAYSATCVCFMLLFYDHVQCCCMIYDV